MTEIVDCGLSQVLKETPWFTNDLMVIDEAIIQNEDAEADSKSDPFCTTWKLARLEDKERAWSKFRIVKSFIAYRAEYKAKGIDYLESGPSFIKKLHNGSICLEDFQKLKTDQIALATLGTWVRMLKNSGDLDNPVSMLEEYRHCGRKSKIDTELRNWIRELSVDQRNLDPSWIYLYLLDQYELMNKDLPFSSRTLQLMVRNFRKDIFTKS